MVVLWGVGGALLWSLRSGRSSQHPPGHQGPPLSCTTALDSVHIEGTLNFQEGLLSVSTR